MSKAQESLSQVKRGRRLLKGVLLVLGAGAILQPAGAVFGNVAQDAAKKDEPAAHQLSKKPGGPGMQKTPVVTPDAKKKGANKPNVKNKDVKSHTAKRGTAKRST